VNRTPYTDQPAAPTVAGDPLLSNLLLDLEDREPVDFDDFWAATVNEARARPAGLVHEHITTGLRTLSVEDVTFPGHGGDPVKGWLLTPADADAPLPAIVQYAGYGDGRGAALQHLLWASCGFAHFVMDNRGQGTDTADRWQRADVGPDGAHVTRGISDPKTFYYRRLITDAVRAVDCLPLHPLIDSDRIVVVGASQGGGLALAVSALAGNIAALLCDIPFMTDWRRATRNADRGPYADIAALCRSGAVDADTAFRTLAYFDGRRFALRAAAPALFSVALMDRVCPPSTVHATYDQYAGPKDLQIWEFSDHEGGGIAQTQRQLSFLATVMTVSTAS
jgi:cephalosporin-C deacetylase